MDVKPRLATTAEVRVAVSHRQALRSKPRFVPDRTVAATHPLREIDCGAHIFRF
jgi:hypothetical protein